MPDPLRARAAGSDHLAEALAGALDAVVPVGLSVRTHEGDVVVAAGTTWARTGVRALLAEPGPLPERLETAAFAVLNAVQDFVVEHTSAQWPPATAGLPLPFAETDGARLRLGYGPPERPVLALPDVELDADG